MTTQFIERAEDGEGQWALDELTDDELSNPETYLGIRLVAQAIMECSGSIKHLAPAIIRRLPPCQLTAPILNDRGDTNLSAVYPARAVALHILDTGNDSCIDALIDSIYDRGTDEDRRRLNSFAVELLARGNGNTIRYLIEYTRISKEDLVHDFLATLGAPGSIKPSKLTHFVLDILQDHMSSDHALYFLYTHLDTGNGNTYGISQRLLGMISPPSVLATRVFDRWRNPRSSVLNLACARHDLELVRLILPLLTREEIERRDEVGQTILFACLQGSAYPDLISAVCDVTSREFRFIRNRDGDTALDVFNAARGMRASDRVRAFCTELLSPGTKKA